MLPEFCAFPFIATERTKGALAKAYPNLLGTVVYACVLFENVRNLTCRISIVWPAPVDFRIVFTP